MTAEVPRRPSLGVDLDGVLANQIVGVLPRIYANYGVELTYEDITHWRLPIQSARVSTDIATEIVAAQTEREYVLSMPVHPGARQMLEALQQDFRIIVLTARAGDTLSWSAEWLRRNSLPFDEIAGSAEAKKSLHGADALVDDYLGNVEEFLMNTSGPAVLIDQPWNRAERDALASFVSAGRLATVSALNEVPPAITELFSRRSE
jgi:uncharacterized HAD superfamily protein